MEKKDLLIIEDHDTLRISLSEWLRDLYPDTIIHTASTGEEGVSKANALNPDLALIDIGLPGIDGIQATKLINNSGLKTKIIVLTMQEGAYYRDISSAAGALEFVYKKDMYKKLPQILNSLL